MTSLEGICVPTRADSDAPAGLIARTARNRHWLWLRAHEGPGVRPLVDLLSACSGLLKHAAATTRPPLPSQLLTFNVRRQVWTLRSRDARIAAGARGASSVNNTYVGHQAVRSRH